ncbi:MAG TPA: GAF domain-containing protein [Solirubrobacter sp.]
MVDRREDAGLVRRPSRLRALAELGANAVTAADALDRIGRVACRVLDVPVVLVNLIGDDRQHFVGCAAGEPWQSTRDLPLTVGFCPFALGAGEAFTLEDARAEPSMASNPAVEQFGVVAYAGVPLRSPDGEPIGTLCALDYEARRWSQDDLALLTDLSAGVIAELQLLAATRLLARHESRLRTLTTLSSALAPAESVREVVDSVGQAVEHLDASAVWVLLVDESEQTLRTAAGEAELDVPLEAPLPPAEVARTGEPDFLTTRAELHTRFAALSEAMPDVGSVAVLPLQAGEDRLGVLGVCFADERPLSGADREYLAALGGISALTLARVPH